MEDLFAKRVQLKCASINLFEENEMLVLFARRGGKSRDNTLTQINDDNLLQTIKDSSLAFHPDQSLHTATFSLKLNYVGL